MEQVTDHAVIRSLERFYDLDTEAIRNLIRARVRAENGKFSVGRGCNAVVRDNVVTTILRRRKQWMR